jgi:hypothetical protein
LKYINYFKSKNNSASMKDELSGIVIIEGTLSRDLSGNLTLSENINRFNQAGQYIPPNKDNRLAENAAKIGYKIGDKIRYICIPQE